MEKDTRPYLPWRLADDFMTAVFIKLGLPEKDARLCSDVLLESDRRGIESHGCNRFKPIYVDRIRAGILNPITKIELLKETPTTAVLDAGDGMGIGSGDADHILFCRHGGPVSGDTVMGRISHGDHTHAVFAGLFNA